MCACETSVRPPAVICGVHEDKQSFRREHNCVLILVIAIKQATDRAFQTAHPQPTRRVRHPPHMKAGLLAQLDELHALAAGRQLGPGALQLRGGVAGCKGRKKHNRVSQQQCSVFMHQVKQVRTQAQQTTKPQTDAHGSMSPVHKHYHNGTAPRTTCALIFRTEDPARSFVYPFQER
jgi:hypothetical protein